MGMNTNSKWTDDDERRLLALKATGKSNFVIANVLRRTAAGVEQRLHILKNRAHKISHQMPPAGGP